MEIKYFEYTFQGTEYQLQLLQWVVGQSIPDANLRILSKDGDDYICSIVADPEIIFQVGMIVASCYHESEQERVPPKMLQLQTDVRCVDAVHIDEDGETSYRYTWAVSSSIEINIGDTLVVEQRVGNKLAFVRAVSAVYMKTTKQHEVDIHPYCAVITNIGHKL